jgi:hypothetical protein
MTVRRPPPSQPPLLGKIPNSIFAENWGDQPFVESTGSWYWGHGRLGPYSIVWFDALTPEGVETRSAYLSKDNEILVSSCAAGSITVRPTGNNATYPPHTPDGPPEGFHIEIEMARGGIFVVDVTPTSLLVNGLGLYYRWAGALKGGVQGGDTYTGTAVFEQFALIP